MLVAFFATSMGWTLSFYFVSVLLPVMAAASYTFNSQIVPRYLLTGRKVKFALYTFYLLIAAIYLELWVIIGALVLLANYSFSELGRYAGDIRLLGLLQFLLVFGDGFLLSWSSLKKRDRELQELKATHLKNQQETLEVVVNRQKVPVSLNEILWIESFSDYVKIHLPSQELVVREKISKLHDQLPTQFLRVHRSFLINSQKVNAFNRSSAKINETNIPFGRKYAQSAWEQLSQVDEKMTMS